MTPVAFDGVVALSFAGASSCGAGRCRQDTMYFSDLTLCYYHRGPLDADSWRAPLLAIGWLERPYDYSRGTAPPGLVDTLERLIAAERNIHLGHHFRGLHECSLCAGGDEGSEALPSSHLNLLIPGEGVVYAAPAGIVHHIQVHSYLPPAAFVEAAMRCPDYGSAAYYDALRVANRGEPAPLNT